MPPGGYCWVHNWLFPMTFVSKFSGVHLDPETRQGFTVNGKSERYFTHLHLFFTFNPTLFSVKVSGGILKLLFPIKEFGRRAKKDEI